MLTVISDSFQDRYANYYKETYGTSECSHKLWPTEFLVRALLSRSQLRNPCGTAKRALDLGFGDGRNLELLSSLFNEIHGVELSQKICDLAAERFPNIIFNHGLSHALPYNDSFFDMVVAVHSIYYCHYADFLEILAECKRVMRSEARLIFSIPTGTSYLLRDATIHGSEYATIRNDPINLRNGIRIKFFENQASLSALLVNNNFRNIQIGKVCANWFGINEDYWIVSVIC
jgi:ubiquinone/menaquinone biosynthesis C-methylase UbiE